MLQAFDNFVNPFKVENSGELFCLSAGAPVPETVASDLLNANDIGREAFHSFVEDRLVRRNVCFHSPLKRNKLKTFTCSTKNQTLTSSQNKVVELKAERNMFGQLVILSERNNISLDRLLTHQLGPIPWALATPDGHPTKTDKAKL